MKRNIIILLLIILIATLIFWNKVANAKSAKVETILNSMTTEEKIAQMLMPAFSTYTDSNNNKNSLTEITEKIEEIVKKYGFAGVIMFQENNSNIEQTVKLIDEFQIANATKENRPQLLISTDQEGGVVTRLSNGTQMPGNMAICATEDVNNAYLARKNNWCRTQKNGV